MAMQCDLPYETKPINALETMVPRDLRLREAGGRLFCDSRGRTCLLRSILELSAFKSGRW